MPIDQPLPRTKGELEVINKKRRDREFIEAAAVEFMAARLTRPVAKDDRYYVVSQAISWAIELRESLDKWRKDNK